MRLSDRKPPLLVALAAGSAGLACWCSLGVLAVAETASGVSRAGLLPPWWMLGVIVAAAIAASTALRVTSVRSVPLFLTLLVVVPWLPIPVPDAALLWAGPAVWFVWAIALAGMFVADGVPAVVRYAAVRAGWYGGRAPWLAAALALLVIGASAWRVSALLPLGDEPHYLIITQSLLEDGDLRIENNHTQRDYLAYVPGTMKPDYLKRGRDGQIYSIHMPGLAALVMPVFALGGYFGVKLLLILLSAGVAAVVWRTARTATGDAGAAWFAWAAIVLTAPWLFLTFTVFPDGLGGMIVMLVVAALVRIDAPLAANGVADPRVPPVDRAWWWWSGVGMACAVLPWLHTRYAVLAVALGLVFVARILGRPRPKRSLAAFAAAPVVSAAGWFAYFYLIYGSINPTSPYGSYTQMALANTMRGVPGLLFDQQFGLVANAPVYVLALLGWIPLARRRPRLAIELALLTVPYCLVTAAYHMWWGGSSSPARFLGPVMLPLAIPTAMAWTGARRPSSRAWCLLLLAVSLVLSAALVGVDGGQFAFNKRDGIALWLSWASPVVSAARGMPSLFRTAQAIAMAELGVWALMGFAAWIAIRNVEGRIRLSSGWLALLVAGAFHAGVAMAITSSWRVERADVYSTASSQLRLVRAAGAGRLPIGVSYAPPGLTSARAVAGAIRLSAPGVVGTDTERWFWFPKMPAGRYRWILDNKAPGATVDVSLSVGRETAPVAGWSFSGLAAGELSREFDLPVNVGSLAVRGQTDPPRVSQQVWLQSVALAASPIGGETAFASAVRLYGLVWVYGFGDGAYLEAPGIWTAGGKDADFAIVPLPGKAQQFLVVRAGPVRTAVTIDSGSWHEELALDPGATRTLELPMLADRRATPLRVRAGPGFRPVDTDPRNADARLLGVWLEIR